MPLAVDGLPTARPVRQLSGSRKGGDKALGATFRDLAWSIRRLGAGWPRDERPHGGEYRKSMQAGCLDRILSLLNLCEVLASQGKGAAARQAVADWEQQLAAADRGSDVAAECRLYAAYMAGDAAAGDATGRGLPIVRRIKAPGIGRDGPHAGSPSGRRIQPLLKEPWDAWRSAWPST